MPEQIREILVDEQDHLIDLATALGIEKPSFEVKKDGKPTGLPRGNLELLQLDFPKARRVACLQVQMSPTSAFSRFLPNLSTFTKDEGRLPQFGASQTTMTLSFPAALSCVDDHSIAWSETFGETMKCNVCLFVPLGSFVFCAILAAGPMPKLQAPAQTAPDNTKMNKDQSSPSADQQKMNSADRAITQKIRKAIHDDKELSTYAHNIKVITQDGKVTLRGPVRSEEEKSALQAKAVGVVGQENVTNQLEVTSSK